MYMYILCLDCYIYVCSLLTFLVKDHKLAQMCPNSTGSEFSAAQGHVKSFADQTFQSMKSKEVRDAGSPPKEFTYRGQGVCTIKP